MDEKFLPEWSEILTELRDKRASDVTSGHQQKGEFSPFDFFEIAATSLDEILDRWIGFERKSVLTDIEAVRAELESVFEFEIEAINRDLEGLRALTHWEDGPTKMAFDSFMSMAEQVRQKYLLKMNTLQTQNAAALTPGGAAAPAGEGKPAKASKEKGKAQNVSGGSGNRGTGAGMAMMFLVGLVLGGGPSVYFWDLSKKAGQSSEEVRAKLAAEKRAMDDSNALLNSRFEQLASGELKSLPEIERTIERIRREADEKKKAVEKDAALERERLMRRIPASERLENALAAVEERRNGSLAEIETAAIQAIEPFEKQKAALQELRAR